MTSEYELKSLYETQLKGRLSELESSRKRIFGRHFLSILLIFGLAGGNYLVVTVAPHPVVMVLSIVGSVAFLIYFIYTTFQQQKQYRQAFKTGVVTELVRLINPEWQYLCNQCIGEDTYQHSGLFPHRYDRYEGDDFVTGRIDKTDFQFSELHTEYKQVTYGSKGQRHEQWITIFRGLFMHADFNKNFAGITFVLPDTAERLFGALGQSLQRLSSRGELVKLENVEFEKLFVVYSSDQVESRYILTPAIMEAMVNLHRRFEGDIYFSFVDSRVYFAKGFSTALFEPNIFRSGVNFSDVKEMFDLLGMISALIQELNLNTRIWTKE